MSPADAGLLVLLAVFIVFEVKTSGNRKEIRKIVSESRTVSRRI